jgi:PAS domain S-box-containing protein
VSNSPAGLDPIRLLLLENNPPDAELCIYELQRSELNFRYEIAQDLVEFRSKFDRGSYDLILSDYNLGDGTGIDALEWIKSQGKAIPFILITGAVGDEVAVECMKRGISDYVLKDRLPALPVAVRRAMTEEALRQDRKEAETRLVEREHHFRALMEHSADGIVLLNRLAEIIFTSHAQTGILGYAASEVTGRSFFEFLHPNDIAEARARFEGLLVTPQGGASAHLRFRAKEGYWRWLECIATNLLGEPSVSGIVVNYRDISDRKRAEEEIRRLNDELESRVEERTAQLEAANHELELEIAQRRKAEKIRRESEERLRILIDGVEDYAIYMLSFDGRVTSWNAGAERIYGYGAAEIIAREFSCFYPEEDVKDGCPFEHLKQAAARGRLEVEGWRIRKDGTPFWANFVLTVLHDPSGKVRGFSNVTRDVTERRRTHRALEELRRQHELILNSAGEGICGVDQAGAVTFINPSGAQMLGWRPQELIGKPLHDCVHHRKPDGTPHPVMECSILAALADGESHPSNSEIFWRKDESSFPVEYVSTPILTEEGKIVGAVILFHDITERRAVERMKDEFISVVSHELRTPLTAIRGALGLLGSGKLCTAQGKCSRMIEVAVSNAGRLTRLVNDILDLERIESGKARKEERICNAGELMQQAAELVRVTADDQGIKLVVRPAHSCVRGDRDQIEQVLLNLLSNAIKFSPRSSEVTLSAEPEGQNVLFRVEDQGRGIPADKLDTIFGKFQQVDASDSRAKGGTGLGLAICRSILAQHGGRIWAESSLGRGSTFFFTLPRVDSAASDNTVEECDEKS